MVNCILKFDKRKKECKVFYDFFLQRWYNYHLLFFGSLILRGKKLAAFKFMLKLKQTLKLKEQNDPYLIFLVAMLKVTPCVLLRSIRLGSGSKGIPMPISEQKQIAYAIKWTVKLLKEKQGSLKISTLADLLILTAYEKGDSVKKKESVYFTAIENRHFVRYFK